MKDNLITIDAKKPIDLYQDGKCFASGNIVCYKSDWEGEVIKIEITVKGDKEK